MLEAALVSVVISTIGVLIQMRNVKKIAHEVSRDVARQAIKKAAHEVKDHEPQRRDI